MKRKIHFDKVSVNQFRRFLAGVVVIFLVFFIFSWWQAGDKAEKEIIERIKIQELITARAGALFLSEYFGPKATSLILLTEMREIKEGRQKEGEKVIEALIEELKGEPLIDIIWVDKNGQSLWATNFRGERVREELFLSDETYFQWAKQQKESGEVFLSEPIISSGTQREKESLIVMASPVFFNQEFNGLVFCFTGLSLFILS